MRSGQSAVVIQVIQENLGVGGEARAGTQAVQASGRRATGHQLVMLQLLQAKRRRAAVHHQHLHPRPVRVQQPPLAPLSCNLLLFYFIFFFFLLSLQLLLLMVDLPQQVVDEDGAPQVGLGVLQEPQLLQGQLQDAAPVLLQYQVLQMTNTKAEDQFVVLHFYRTRHDFILSILEGGYQRDKLTFAAHKSR